ncbi:phospholipase ABHD3 [Manduca sexta]|uniref:AB hydrolase-1 domain-containing protein n=1 Tax=Manduca sexta TaxID=7130 RepID=A0A921ZDD7_MANSE|nr:phospholipase ABHD3 [Manduca sexta]KAG6454742.1 hypothetical protein O3G_MSEX008846 [Manduca sexta]
MSSPFMYILEEKKELLVGFSLFILYITYYIVEVVKKPILVCGKAEFREFLQNNVPLLGECYWPTPWCVESRLQTVIGSILRSWLSPTALYRREVLVLSDGGQVALDWIEPEVAEPRAVLLVLPGLTGSVHSDYVRCIATAAQKLKTRCVVFNNRGLGGLPLTTPRLYCAVSHDDLAEVARAVRARCGDAPLLAAGVSLGGLILGHYLAAQGERALVHAALVVSSPLDVIKGTDYMNRLPFNALLSYLLARDMRNTIRSHAPVRGLSCDWRRVERAKTVRQFDEAFTAHHFGFDSVEAYYRAATLRDKLEDVRVPLLCLCAGDDPFQPLDAIPMREAERAQFVALAVTARGGHIGFLEGWWPARAPSRQYLTRLTEQYFSALLTHPELLHNAPAP